MSDIANTSDEVVVVPPKRRSPLQRVGCSVALVLWFTLLLVPCFCFLLATQEEITIPQGGAPGQAIRIWLIMEAEERGLGISSTSAQQTSDNALCVETTTRFVLWMGRGESQVSCECYERNNDDVPWSAISVGNQACTAP